jgi:hypothetical protein
MPILASDELKKHPDSQWRQPAISPEMERRGEEYTVNDDGTPAYITKARTHSRSSSRNNSMPVQRSIASPAQFDRGGTPLESHKEYEPLFPEDEEEGTKRPKSQVDKLKRPSVARHQFPSQDTWEDTPGSLQLQTTVETPEVPDEPETPAGDVSASKVFEKPETEEARKDNITKEDQQSFLPEHTRRFAAENKHLGLVRDQTPLRPGMQQRFPSQDIWEDAPEHGRLETTVSTPQTEETTEYAEDSPIGDKPSVPARPSIPARPQKKETSPVDKKGPIIPDRPKPQIPVRPSKPVTTARGEEGTEESRAVDSDATQTKAKPPVPARPAGSKIAALQAGFLKDLNNKLGVGPQAPKVKEPEPEAEPEPAAPLQDARKGRAKGPQRRKPAASPTPAATVTAEVAVPRQTLSLGPVTAIWSLDHDGALDVPAATLAAKLQSKLQAPGRTQEPEADTNVTDANAEAEQEDEVAGLGRTTTEGSEHVEPTQPTTSGGESADPSAISKLISKGSEAVSTLLGRDVPLVSETAKGSVDAPGAFLGTEVSDSNATGGVSKEEQPLTQKSITEVPSAEKPSTEQSAQVKSIGDRIADELETKKEESPSTAGAAPANEGAGSTQSLSG